jgi:diguanylate cyclase (GGDEF)-like protein
MNRKILIVDDCKVSVQLLSKLLNKAGYKNIECSYNGHEAEELIKTNEFALIITDFYMPDLTGYEIIKQTKKKDRATQCIVITGKPTIDNIIRCMRNDGAYDFFKKPFDVKKFQNSVKKSLGLYNEILKIRENNAKIKELALYDSLTKLPKTELFLDRLENSIHHAVRSRKFLAVLYMDLDGFKQINDQYGHLIGDNVLKITATRLKNCLRQSDTICRLGGDEFAAIIPSFSTDRLDEMRVNIQKICNKIINKMAKPMIIEKHSCHIGISIGISLFPSDTKNQKLLLKKADQAMYIAKKNGKNQYIFYS